jgi:hypothetical protein
MTGAGSATVAVALEDSFRTLPGVPTWFSPGEGVEVTDATLDRQLIDNPQSNDARGDGQVEGNVRGSFTLSFTYAGTNWHEWVFPATGPVELAPNGLVNTATIYLGADLPGNETDQARFLSGAAVESMTITYTEGETVTVELSGFYFDEPEVGSDYGDAPTDAEIDRPPKADIVTAAGFDLQVDGASIDRLQSVSVTVAGMAAERAQQSQYPDDVVVGNLDQSLSVTAILSDNTLRQRTYGSDTAVEPVSEVEETTATVTLDARDGTTDTYNLTRVQPATTSWESFTSQDEQTTNPTDLTFVNMEVA